MTTNTNNNVAKSEDRHKPSTRRRKAIAARFFTYGAMTIATIVGVIFCISWAMGYRFDLLSGEISQVALLQFNSFPTGASVDINGDRILARTPTRSNIKTGDVTVSMSKQGYRSWSKTVAALPSSVRWLNYIRLIPQNVQTKSVKQFPAVIDMVASPDRKWAIIVTDDNSIKMTLLNVERPNEPKLTDITLDIAQISGIELVEHKYQIVEWDEGSRYVLIQHQYGEEIEHLEYDRHDKITRNLTRDFGMKLTDPHFSGTNGDVIFALTGSDLRKIDYGSRSISAPLATNVTSYVMYSNSRIAFVSKQKKDDKVVQTVSIYDDGRIKDIRTYQDEKPIKIGFSRNNDVDYLAIARDETVAVYPNPLESGNHGPDETSTDTAYLSSPGGIDWMEISGNGRFVMAGRDHKTVCYDVETNENYSFELERLGEPYWIDDYHLLDERSGELVMVEFDGHNAEKLVSGRLDAFLSNDGKILYSIDTINGGVVLQSSKMTTD